MLIADMYRNKNETKTDIPDTFDNIHRVHQSINQRVVLMNQLIVLQ